MSSVPSITYCAGYKFQLREDCCIQTRVYPSEVLKTELVQLHPDGTLVIRKYFAWDGCSGPTWDDKTNARACLVHDALYYLMREGLLGIGWRDTVDDELMRIMLEDGAWWIRAWYYKMACHLFAAPCALAKSARKILTTPIRGFMT